MKLSSIIIFILVAVAVSSIPLLDYQAARAAGKATATDSLVILYTASARGQIRSCNCTKFRFGGYGREMTLLKSIRTQSPDTVLLEGGDIAGGDGFQARLKAQVAAKALKLLGYGAMTPGDEDLGLGGDRKITPFESGSAPIVCANLLAKGEPKKPRYRSNIVLKTRNGLKVGVIGLIDPALGGDLLEKTFGDTIADPVKSLKPLIPSVRKGCDLIVVVFHGTPKSAEPLIAVKGIDLVLCTHRGERDNLFPGKDSNKVQAPIEQRESVFVVSAATNENWSLGRIDLKLTSKKKIKSAKHALIYLDRRYDEHSEMVKVYDEYNVKVAETVLAESSEFRKNAESLLAKRGLNVSQMRDRLKKSPLATSKGCKDCHEDIHKSWSATRHAHAMESLVKTKQEYDPECVGCHVTGMTVRNGYANYKETPELANVQCEACHGPALDHIGNPTEKRPAKTGEQTCRSCHNEDRHPDFEFDTAWEEIKH